MKTIGMVCALALLCCGCEQIWDVKSPEFYRYKNKDVRVTGIITRLAENDDTAKLEVRYYLDGEYKTLIGTDESNTAEYILHPGQSQEFRVINTKLRLGRTPGQYPVMCVEVRVEDSNLNDWTKLGCTVAE